MSKKTQRPKFKGLLIMSLILNEQSQVCNVTEIPRAALGCMPRLSGCPQVDKDRWQTHHGVSAAQQTRTHLHYSPSLLLDTITSCQGLADLWQESSKLTWSHAAAAHLKRDEDLDLMRWMVCLH